MHRSALRGLFCIAAATSAATLADPLLESASNAGWFGPGNFTDRSNADVVPALVFSVALGLFFALFRARLLIGPRSVAFGRSLREALGMRASKPLVRLLPAILAAQVGILFCMETLEQVVVDGHPLGGFVWLGAPVAIALGLHAVACIAVTFALARLLDGLTGVAVHFALFFREIFPKLTLLRRPPAQIFERAIDLAQPEPLASRAGLRAPPFLNA